MNYDDYYAQQVGGALPYFAGARVQRGHVFGSLFGGLLRSVAPLIKRGALALGNRALKTGAQIAGDILSGENIRTAAKRRTKTAGREVVCMRGRTTSISVRLKDRDYDVTPHIILILSLTLTPNQ